MGSQRIGHDCVANTIFFAAKDGEALYSQQKQYQEARGPKVLKV